MDAMEKHKKSIELFKIHESLRDNINPSLDNKYYQYYIKNKDKFKCHKFRNYVIDEHLKMIRDLIV